MGESDQKEIGWKFDLKLEKKHPSSMIDFKIEFREQTTAVAAVGLETHIDYINWKLHPVLCMNVLKERAHLCTQHG